MGGGGLRREDRKRGAKRDKGSMQEASFEEAPRTGKERQGKGKEVHGRGMGKGRWCEHNTSKGVRVGAPSCSSSLAGRSHRAPNERGREEEGEATVSSCVSE